jgi:hypothetical protein
MVVTTPAAQLPLPFSRDSARVTAVGWSEES